MYVLPRSDPILLLGDHGLRLLEVLLKILKAGQHLVEVLRFLAVLDGLDIGVDGRIPKQLIQLYLTILSVRELLSPLLLGGPDHPLLIFLVVREEKGGVHSGGRLLLDLKGNNRFY